ncbi:hypothetical protein HDV00_005888 [Rhizophlyctis rosea]|nr:hypothetical protein HDV00_005888 [Rhizophlyctis rosea]
MEEPKAVAPRLYIRARRYQRRILRSLVVVILLNIFSYYHLANDSGMPPKLGRMTVNATDMVRIRDAVLREWEGVVAGRKSGEVDGGAAGTGNPENIVTATVAAGTELADFGTEAVVVGDGDQPSSRPYTPQQPTSTYNATATANENDEPTPRNADGSVVDGGVVGGRDAVGVVDGVGVVQGGTPAVAVQGGRQAHMLPPFEEPLPVPVAAVVEEQLGEGEGSGGEEGIINLDDANEVSTDTNPGHGHSQSPTLTTNADRPRNFFAVSDLHGDMQAFLLLLRLAGLLHLNKETWTGEKSILIICGDIFDRGPHVRAILSLVQKLEVQAALAGGEVKYLIGNHEDMHKREPESFGGEDRRRAALSKRGKQMWVVGVESGERRVFAEFEFAGFDSGWEDDIGDDGDVATWMAPSHGETSTLRESSALCSIPPHQLPLIPDVNNLVRNKLQHLAHKDLAADPLIIGQETSVLWYRAWAKDPEPGVCEEVEAVKAALGIRHVVVGHTIQPAGQVVVRCGGSIVLIDTANSRWTKKPPSRNIVRFGVDGRAYAISPDRSTILW